MKDMETNKNIDWEQRRYEIAKEVMASSFSTINHYKSIQSYVACCVEIAELLVEELQKPKQQDKFSRIVEQAPEMYKALKVISSYRHSFISDPAGVLNEVIEIAKRAIDKCNVNYPEIEE